MAIAPQGVAMDQLYAMMLLGTLEDTFIHAVEMEAMPVFKHTEILAIHVVFNF